MLASRANISAASASGNDSMDKSDDDDEEDDAYDPLESFPDRSAPVGLL